MSRQQLSLAEQETSSSQAPYHSLRHKWQSSFTPLFLLSPQNLTILRGPLFWDNVLDTAEVDTHDPRLLNKLRELSRQFPESFVLKKSEPGRSETYRIPKRCVGVRPPYSERRREQQRQDAQQYGLPFMMKEAENSED